MEHPPEKAVATRGTPLEVILQDCRRLQKHDQTIFPNPLRIMQVDMDPFEQLDRVRF